MRRLLSFGSMAIVMMLSQMASAETSSVRFFEGSSTRSLKVISMESRENPGSRLLRFEQCDTLADKTESCRVIGREAGYHEQELINEINILSKQIKSSETKRILVRLGIFTVEAVGLVYAGYRFWKTATITTQEESNLLLGAGFMVTSLVTLPVFALSQVVDVALQTKALGFGETQNRQNRDSLTSVEKNGVPGQNVEIPQGQMNTFINSLQSALMNIGEAAQ